MKRLRNWSIQTETIKIVQSNKYNCVIVVFSQRRTYECDHRCIRKRYSGPRPARELQNTNHLLSIVSGPSWLLGAYKFIKLPIETYICAHMRDKLFFLQPVRCFDFVCLVLINLCAIIISLHTLAFIVHILSAYLKTTHVFTICVCVNTFAEAISISIRGLAAPIPNMPSHLIVEMKLPKTQSEADQFLALLLHASLSLCVLACSISYMIYAIPHRHITAPCSENHSVTCISFPKASNILADEIF